MQTIDEQVPEVFGRTVEWAGVVTAKSGDEEFIIRFVGGGQLVVGAWQVEGRPIEMAAEFKSNP